MSELKQHQADQFLNQEGIYREGSKYLCVRLTEVEFKNNIFSFKFEVTCDFYFGSSNDDTERKYDFHEGAEDVFGPTFSFSGIEDIVSISNNQISIMYVGYVLLSPKRVALFRQKDRDFFYTH